MVAQFQYIYGPVYSWRLGNSLGVDPLAGKEKICNMDCTYCQLGDTAALSSERKVYVPVEKIIEEINNIPPFFIDYITFSGRGEPTLAKNLGEMIRAIQAVRREKVAVITNSILLDQTDVQDDLMAADFVLAKLDAADQKMFDSINRPSSVDHDHLIKGIIKFRLRFKGKFALQIMLLKDNFEYLRQLGNIATLLDPHEVQLNTPLRPCAQQPLGKDRLEKAKDFFKGLSVISCYDAPINDVKPLDESATIARHGNYRKSRYVY